MGILPNTPRAREPSSSYGCEWPLWTLAATAETTIGMAWPLPIKDFDIKVLDNTHIVHDMHKFHQWFVRPFHQIILEVENWLGHHTELLIVEILFCAETLQSKTDLFDDSFPDDCWKLQAKRFQESTSKIQPVDSSCKAYYFFSGQPRRWLWHPHLSLTQTTVLR